MIINTKLIEDLDIARTKLNIAIEENRAYWDYCLNKQTEEQNDAYAELMQVVDRIILESKR